MHQIDGFSHGLLAWNALSHFYLLEHHPLIDPQMVAMERLKVLLWVCKQHHTKVGWIVTQLQHSLTVIQSIFPSNYMFWYDVDMTLAASGLWTVIFLPSYHAPTPRLFSWSHSDMLRSIADSPIPARLKSHFSDCVSLWSSDDISSSDTSSEANYLYFDHLDIIFCHQNVSNHNRKSSLHRVKHRSHQAHLCFLID